jgi:hypothetical protein
MSKEILIDHKDIADPQTITAVNEKKFKEAGLDMHKNEVDALEDDHKKGVRRLKIRNPKYFGPWRHRG